MVRSLTKTLCTLEEPLSVYLDESTIGGPSLVFVCSAASVLWSAIPWLPLAQMIGFWVAQLIAIRNYFRLYQK